MTGQPRLVKLADLWQRRSAKGSVYFSGFMGDVQVLLFRDGKKPHPTRPDEEVIVWKLLIQERDPNRRPQQRQERQEPQQEILPPERSAPRNARQDPRQAATEEWAARFDERGPDQEPGF